MHVQRTRTRGVCTPPAAAPHAALSVPTSSQAHVRACYCARSTLSSCTYAMHPQHSEQLLQKSRAVLGDRITFAVVRELFFRHFW